MPIASSIQDAFTLNQMGKYTAYCPQPHIIEAADAVSIEADNTGNWLYPFDAYPEDAYYYTIKIPKGFAAIIERFDWGNSDNDARIFYELWHDIGEVGKYIVNYDDVPGSFHSCGVLTNSCDNNDGIHPMSGKYFEFRIWNRSASDTYGQQFGQPVDPVDAYIELSVWMYMFRTEYLETITEASNKDIIDILRSQKGIIEDVADLIRAVPSKIRPRHGGW